MFAFCDKNERCKNSNLGDFNDFAVNQHFKIDDFAEKEKISSFITNWTIYF